jgi:hypothetical protein
MYFGEVSFCVMSFSGKKSNKMSFGKISLNKVPFDKMSFGKMPFYEMSFGETPLLLDPMWAVPVDQFFCSTQHPLFVETLLGPVL